jgi:hypothetical protein
MVAEMVVLPVVLMLVCLVQVVLEDILVMVVMVHTLVIMVMTDQVDPVVEASVEMSHLLCMEVV